MTSTLRLGYTHPFIAEYETAHGLYVQHQVQYTQSTILHLVSTYENQYMQHTQLHLVPIV